VDVDSFLGESFAGESFFVSEDEPPSPPEDELDSEEPPSDDADVSPEDPDGDVELDEDRLSFL